jgi:hypothetical protein
MPRYFEVAVGVSENPTVPVALTKAGGAGITTVGTVV